MICGAKVQKKNDIRKLLRIYFFLLRISVEEIWKYGASFKKTRSLACQWSAGKTAPPSACEEELLG